MRWEFGLLLAFCGLAAFALSRTWIMNWSVDHSIRAESLVDLCNESKTRLMSIVATVENSESEQRAFFLTRDAAFADAVEESKSTSLGQLQKLRTDCKMLGIAQRDVEALESHVNRVYQRIDLTVSVIKRQKNTNVKFVREQDSIPPIDFVRSTVTSLASQLDSSIQRAKLQSSRSANVIQNLNLIGGLLSVLLLSSVFLLTRKLINSEYEARVKEERVGVELARAVRERTAELESAKSELEAFSYSVSHDLRSPLRAVLAYSRILEEDYSEKLDSDGRETLERIGTSGRRMSDLIDSLLALSNLSRSGIEIEPVNVSELAESILRDLDRANPNTARTWHVVPGLIVDGDRRMLVTLMDNLLGNAFKFSKLAENPRIEVGIENNAIVIRDNGIGFNSEYAANMFQAFQRLHHDRQFEGTGIGLAIVDRIVRRHGGKIWAESVEGQGAAFFVRIGEPHIQNVSATVSN